jgi:CO/xanthine dehydrogenase Mo-binding subunit
MLNKEFSRKSFLRGGGALIVGFSLAGAGLAGKAEAAESPYASNGPYDPRQVDSWIAIHADNTVSLMTGRVELGQGSSVGLSMIAAEELDVDLSQIKFVNHDTNVTPNTGTISASSSIRAVGPMVRGAAVSARQALLGLASAALGVPVAVLTVSSGVVSGGGRSVKYGDLLGDKLFKVTMPASYGVTPESGFTPNTPFGLAAGGPGAKPVSQYRLVGTDQVRFDIPDKVNGKFTYVHSVKVPGMWHARLVRPRGQAAYPSGAAVVSVDESSIKHTSARLLRKGDFLAVVAEEEYQAIQAAAQIKVKWAEPPKMSSSGNIWKQMREFDMAGLAPASVQLSTGNVDAAFAAAPVKVSGSSYRFHYNGHLPIGPSCAVADVTSNGAVVFSNTQNAYSTRQQVAGVIGLPVNNVRVIYQEGSSVFGGSPYDDCAMAAALVSQLAGRPVRLQFMRWDEHGWDNLGPISMADLRGGVDANGKIVAHEYVGFAQPGTGLTELTQQLTGTPVPTPGLGSTSIASGYPRGRNAEMIGEQYALSNRRVIAKSLPLFNNYFKMKFLRGVGAVPATFAMEQFMDELAYAAKMDPVEFRRKNIGGGTPIGPGGMVTTEADMARAASALEAAAKLANWRPRVAASELKSGDVVTGRGVALGGLQTTWAAVVADVEVNKKTGTITVKDLWAAEQAGLTVAPEQLHNQMIGCLVTGTSRALCEQVRFDTRRITGLDWVGYPTLRFKDAPRTHVISVQRTDLQPGGSGEPTLVPVPPAIANAFFDATGVRIREAPMTPARVRGVLKAAGVA